MCIVKSPKIKPQGKEKEPQYLRNPYLDGVGPEAAALRAGRNSLRITPGGSDNTSPHLFIPSRGGKPPSSTRPRQRPYSGIQIGRGWRGGFSAARMNHL